MKPRMTIKIGIDLVMWVLLLFLMVYQITGQKLHEWLGAGMLVLFIVHNILNFRWYRGLCKGSYRLLRILQTILNFSILLSVLCLGFSGIVMSRYVFAPLSIHGPIATARTMHMAASYWGFVLMGLHLGFHWEMIMGMFCRLRLGKKRQWILCLAAVLIAGYGLLCFVRKDIISYMFLKNQFVFFDFEQGAVLALTEYLAMMGFWIFVGFCIAKGCRKTLTSQFKRKKEMEQ